MKNITKQRRFHKGKTIGLAVGSILVFGNSTQAKFEGFYAGASVGYLNQNTRLDAKQNPADSKADMNNTHSQRGLPTAELFLGWGTVFREYFYGGLEGKIDWVMGGSQKVAEDTGFIFTSGRKGTGVAILARLGYLISSSTMIYGGVGVKIARFEYNLFEKADKISAPFSKRSLHLLTEVGVETFLNAPKNLAFRFSYSFMPKRDIARKTRDFPENHMYRENGMFKTDTSEHAVKVSLVYCF